MTPEKATERRLPAAREAAAIGASLRTALCLLIASHVPTACAANLLANPDFGSNSIGWTLAGAATFDNMSGSPTPGSVHLSNSSGSTSVSQCVSPFTPQPIDLIVRFHAPVSASLALASASAYDGLNCTGTVLVGTSVNTNGAVAGFPGSFNGNPQTWNEISVVNASLTTVGIQSVQVSVGVLSSADPPEDVWFDLIRFGPSGSAPVVLQSFEVD